MRSYLYDPKREHVLPRNSFRGLHIEAVKFYTSNLLCALHHMHKRNIVYRDVKPENFLVSHHDKSVDYWSLGCSTYELYFNKTPFEVVFEKNFNSEVLLSDSRLFPDPIDPDFTALVKGMLRSDSSLRLGNTGVLTILRLHLSLGPIFHGMQLRHKRIQPPFGPSSRTSPTPNDLNGTQKKRVPKFRFTEIRRNFRLFSKFLEFVFPLSK